MTQAYSDKVKKIKIVKHVMIIFLTEQVITIATVTPLNFAFIKEIFFFSSCIVELYKHLAGVLRTLEESEKHSPAAHASLALLSCS